MVMKVKKKRKSPGLRGKTTHGHGARKKWKKSGHKGGVGMAGSGKKGDQKKTLVQKLYGNKYFGKKGITSRGNAKDRRIKVNVGDIEKNTSKFSEVGGWLDLSKYKILGNGHVTKKFKIKALEASSSAMEKIKKAGGEIEVVKKRDLDSDIDNSVEESE